MTVNKWNHWAQHFNSKINWLIKKILNYLWETENCEKNGLLNVDIFGTSQIYITKRKSPYVDLFYGSKIHIYTHLIFVTYLDYMFETIVDMSSSNM